MTTDAVDPAGRVLWCLRRRASDVRCVLFPDAVPILVRVLQDRDVVLAETFSTEALARAWAVAYAERLRDQGWRDSPADCSPSSAA